MFLKKHCSIVENLVALNDQKKSVHITRLLVPLVIAFMMSGFVGFARSGHAFASTTSDRTAYQFQRGFLQFGA